MEADNPVSSTGAARMTRRAQGRSLSQAGPLHQDVELRVEHGGGYMADVEEMHRLAHNAKVNCGPQSR